MNRWNVIVSRFRFAASNEPQHVRLTGPEVFSNFREAPVSGPDDKTGKDGNLWCVGWFYPGKGREPKGGTAKNIKEASFLVFDFDPKQGHSIQDVEKVLDDFGWEYVIYSTFSHGPGAHAFRVVIPLTRSLTRGEHEVLWEDVFQRLARKGVAPDHLPDIGRMFYLPTTRVGLGPPEHYRYFRHVFGEEGSDTETELYPVEWYLSELAKRGIVPRVYPPPGGTGPVNGTAGPVNGTAPRSSPQPSDGSQSLLEKLKAREAAREAANPKPVVEPGADADVDLSALDGIEHAHETESYPKIKAGCAAVAHFATDAEKLSEPEWYGDLSIRVRCRGGHELIHQDHDQHKGYDREDTIAKAKRALEDTGPFTCVKIETLSKECAAACKACPHYGKLTSPIQLGKADRDKDTHEEVYADDMARAKAAFVQAKADLTAARKAASSALMHEAREKDRVKTLLSVEERARVLEEERVKVKDAKRAVNDAEKVYARAERLLKDLQSTGGEGTKAIHSKMKINPVNRRPEAIGHNVAMVFDHDDRYKGKLWFNEFSGLVHYDPNIKSRSAEDDQDISAMLDLQRRYDLFVSDAIIRKVSYERAKRNTRHPVREYLRAQVWDGTKRAHLMMERGFGAQCAGAQTKEYLEEAGIKFLVSCVARVLEPRVRAGKIEGGPGCKMDTMIVLVGDQGKYKSTCLRILSKGYFADTKIDLMNKDSYLQIHGNWLYEIAELDSFRKADTTRIRGFLSSQEDNYRPPFGHHVVKKLRQTVLVGTTNEEEFIDDPAGTRRFVPIRVTACDPDWFLANVDQLWAEAVAMYDQGVIWWYEGESATRLAEQGQHFREDDPWLEQIVGHLGRTGAREFTIGDLLQGALFLEVKNVTKAHKNRVGAVLRVLGIPSEQAPKTDPRGRVRIYRVPPGMVFVKGKMTSDTNKPDSTPDFFDDN